VITDPTTTALPIARAFHHLDVFPRGGGLKHKIVVIINTGYKIEVLLNYRGIPCQITQKKNSPSPIVFKFFLPHLFGEKRKKIAMFICWVKSCPRYGSSSFDRNTTTCNGQTLVSRFKGSRFKGFKSVVKLIVVLS